MKQAILKLAMFLGGYLSYSCGVALLSNLYQMDSIQRAFAIAPGAILIAAGAAGMIYPIVKLIMNIVEK